MPSFQASTMPRGSLSASCSSSSSVEIQTPIYVQMYNLCTSREKCKLSFGFPVSLVKGSHAHVNVVFDTFPPCHLAVHWDCLGPGGLGVPGSPEHLRPGHLHHQRHPGHPHPPELRLLAVHVWPHPTGLGAGAEKADKQGASSPQRSLVNDVGKINQKLFYYAKKNPFPISIYYNFFAVIG